MEEELNELRKRLASQQSPTSEQPPTAASNGHATVAQDSAGPGDQLDSEDVVGALLDMKRGVDGPGATETRSRKLEEVFLSGDQIQELFEM